MRKISVGTFLTLDGVMQAPGDSREDMEGGFEYGGWQMPYFDDDFGRIMGEIMARQDALLLGRKTYQLFASFWPFQPDDDPTAKVLNSVPKYVASNTLDEVTWNNSTLLNGNVAEKIARLKESSGDDLSVVGSGQLAQTLMEHDLVDEYVLWIHPLVLGDGKRLFKEGGPRIPLKLVDTQTTGSGIVVLTYRPESKG